MFKVMKCDGRDGNPIEMVQVCDTLSEAMDKADELSYDVYDEEKSIHVYTELDGKDIDMGWYYKEDPVHTSGVVDLMHENLQLSDMTVEDLIKILQIFPKDTKVCACGTTLFYINYDKDNISFDNEDYPTCDGHMDENGNRIKM